MHLDSAYTNDANYAVRPLSSARRFRFRKEKGSINGAMDFRRSPLEIPSIQYNGLSNNMYLRFNFKVNPIVSKSYNRMTIITNGCTDVTPTLAVSFIPANQTLVVRLGTDMKSLHLFLKINKVSGTAILLNFLYKIC